MNISAPGIPERLHNLIINEAEYVEGLKYHTASNGEVYYHGRCYVLVNGNRYRVDGISNRVAKIRIREVCERGDE